MQATYVTFFVCITVLIIMCSGEPDLLDAITGLVKSLKP